MPARSVQLPRPLLDFITLFNRRAYWESHEVLEEAWRAGRSRFYQGLILYASALVHAQRNNPHGVRAQFRKAEARLAGFQPAYLGIDVAELLRHSTATHELLGRLDTLSPEVEERLMSIQLVPRPELLRGDEPELLG